MDMGISHYDVCPEKKSSGQTLGLKTRSDTNRAVWVITIMVIAFLVYEFFKIHNLNCDYINPTDSRPIKCQILALFSSANQKNNSNYMYLVIIFFHQNRFWVWAISR